MSKDKFDEVIKQEFSKFESQEMQKDKYEIIEDSYTIAKMTAIKDYLLYSDDESIQYFYSFNSYAINLMDALYRYELNYDSAMWCDILKDENVEEIILTLMKKFAEKSVDNCRVLIRSNDRIADIMIKLQQKQRAEALQAAYMAVIQRTFNTDDYRTYFASMVPVCQVLFPLGNADGECRALQEYFKEFIKLLHNKKAFDIERDKSWAEQYGYFDYLRLVLDNTSFKDDYV